MVEKFVFASPSLTQAGRATKTKPPRALINLSCNANAKHLDFPETLLASKANINGWPSVT